MPSLPPREPSKRPSERAQAASPSTVGTDPLPPSSRRRVVIRKIQPRPQALVASQFAAFAEEVAAHARLLGRELA